jgi:hypothetical protein
MRAEEDEGELMTWLFGIAQGGIVLVVLGLYCFSHNTLGVALTIQTPCLSKLVDRELLRHVLMLRVNS